MLTIKTTRIQIGMSKALPGNLTVESSWKQCPVGKATGYHFKQKQCRLICRLEQQSSVLNPPGTYRITKYALPGPFYSSYKRKGLKDWV